MSDDALLNARRVPQDPPLVSEQSVLDSAFERAVLVFLESVPRHVDVERALSIPVAPRARSFGPALPDSLVVSRNLVRSRQHVVVLVVRRPVVSDNKVIVHRSRPASSRRSCLDHLRGRNERASTKSARFETLQLVSDCAGKDGKQGRRVCAISRKVLVSVAANPVRALVVFRAKWNADRSERVVRKGADSALLVTKTALTDMHLPIELGSQYSWR